MPGAGCGAGAGVGCYPNHENTHNETKNPPGPLGHKELNIFQAEYKALSSLRFPLLPEKAIYARHPHKCDGEAHQIQCKSVADLQQKRLKRGSGTRTRGFPDFSRQHVTYGGSVPLGVYS